MAADQLSKLNADGTVLGQSATDKIGFFGKTARIRITAFNTVSAGETTANVKARLNKVILGLRNVGLSS